MPGAEHVLAYHLTAKGSGWAATAGEPPVRLNSGDIVMFPRGDSHVLSSAPGLLLRPAISGTLQPEPFEVEMMAKSHAEAGRRGSGVSVGRKG